MAHILGAVLAAGSGTRLGAPKAGLVVDGATLIDRAVAVLVAAGCDDVLAVVRADGATVPGARAIINPRPEDGLRSSLALAVDVCDPGYDALAIVLVDMPGVGPDAVAAVLSAWQPGRIAIGRYGAHSRGRGRSSPAHPIVMSVDLWRAALSVAAPDEGARAFLGAHNDLIDEVTVVGSDVDIDTLTDLEAWNARHRRTDAT